MALLDRLFGNRNQYDEDEGYEDYDDEENEEDGDQEDEDDENPSGFGDEDENPDGFSGSPEIDPNSMPFDDDDEENNDDEDGASGEGKAKTKKDKKNKNSQNDDGKVKVKGKVNKNSSKAAMKKNAITYGCLPFAEGTCPFCHQFSIFKSMRFGDMFFKGACAVVSKQVITTFYCMNKGCKKNWKTGYCFRCAGERYIGKKLPMKRILNKD